MSLPTARHLVGVGELHLVHLGLRHRRCAVSNRDVALNRRSAGARLWKAFEHGDFKRIATGYAIMRLPLIAQWLRAAHGDPAHRGTAIEYALGIALVHINGLRLVLGLGRG